MNIINFKSQQPRTFFSPSWHFVLGESTIENVDFKQIAEYILIKEI
jgi:hypothetical protein